MIKSKSKLTKQLDIVFSAYIRRRNADHAGTCECITCGKKDHWKNMHAGHFMSRSKISTRWHEQNVQVQCVGCNIFKHGEQYKFSVALDRKYGKGTADKLLYLSNQSGKYSALHLATMIDHYNELLKGLP